jgi:hypothetical protein
VDQVLESVDHAGSVYHGPSVNGQPELARAWLSAAPVLKGTSQGWRAADGEVAGRRRGMGGSGRCASERLT